MEIEKLREISNTQHNDEHQVRGKQEGFKPQISSRKK
jgi:hypothetical protein